MIQLNPIGTLFASPAVKSLLLEYGCTCLEPSGKVLVLYGVHGPGKTSTLAALVCGPTNGSWCPSKSMLVETIEQPTGNEWMRELRRRFKYPDNLKPERFAVELVRSVAKEKSSLTKLAEKLGKKHSDVLRPHIEIHGLTKPEESLDNDKHPVIASDNVDCSFTEAERRDEKHREFFAFVLGLKDSAHAQGVVFVLGSKNLDLCKSMSALNGFGKICPVDISCSEDLRAYDAKYRVTETGTFGMVPRTLALDETMGWTQESMEQCLSFQFPDLSKTQIRELVRPYVAEGAIRHAVEKAKKLRLAPEPNQIIPQVSTKSTGTSTFIDSGEQDDSTKTAGNHSLPKVSTKSTGTSTSLDSGEQDISRCLVEIKSSPKHQPSSPVLLR